MNRVLVLSFLALFLGACTSTDRGRVADAPVLAPAPATWSSLPADQSAHEVTRPTSVFAADAFYTDEVALLEGRRQQERARVLTERLHRERDDVDARIALAHLLLEEGHPDAAVQPLRDALLLQPSRHDVAALLTRAYMEAGRGDAALKLAWSLVNQADLDAGRWILLAEVQRRIGEAEQAEEAASQALLLDPYAHGAKAILATIYSDRGNILFARQLWRELQGKPGVKQDIVAYRLARLDLSEENLKSALRHLDDAITLNPKFAPALNDRGLVYVRLARLEDAERDFAAAVEAKPDFGEAGLNLANLRIERDLPDTAMALLSKAEDLGVEREAYTVAAARLYALHATSATGRARALEYLSEAKSLVSGDTLLAVERAIGKLESLPPPVEQEPRLGSGEGPDKESSPDSMPGLDDGPSGSDEGVQPAPLRQQEVPEPRSIPEQSRDPEVDPYLPSVD